MLLTALAAGSLIVVGCGSSNSGFVSTAGFTNSGGGRGVPFQQPPQANDDAFPALGNAVMTQSAPGVLGNDLSKAPVVDFDTVGTQGGALDLNADGSFTYTPVFGFVGSERFEYTISNDMGSSTATVTFTSTGRGFFVNNTVGGGGNGSQTAPFNTLAQATTAATSGDTVVVFRGDGTTSGLSGQVDLPAGVDLIGEGSGLILSQTVVAPGQDPVLTGPIICGGDNLIEGLTIEDATNEAVDINNVGNITVRDCTFIDTTNYAVEVINVSGTLLVEDCTFIVEDVDSRNCLLGFTEEDVQITWRNNEFFIRPPAGDLNNIWGISFQQGAQASFILENNRAVVSNPASSATGLSPYARTGAQVDISVLNNTFEGFGSTALYLTTDSGIEMTGEITGNTFSNCTSEIFYLAVDSLFSVRNNIVRDIPGNAFRFDTASAVGAQYIVEGNEFVNVPGTAILMDPSVGPIDTAIRNNVTSNVGEAVFLSPDSGDSMCADISDNQFDADIVLEENNSSGFDVEQLNSLTTINQLTNSAEVVITGTVNQVADGFCGL